MNMSIERLLRISGSFKSSAYRLAAIVLSATATVLIPAWGQQEGPAARMIRGAESTKKVSALSIARDLTKLPKPKAWAVGDPIKEIPRRSYGRTVNVPKPEGKRDPLLGFQSRMAAAAA